MLAEFERERREAEFRYYITDCLKVISENTARSVREGMCMSTRYYDLVNKPEEDTRTGDEIVLDIIKKAGLEVTK